MTETKIENARITGTSLGYEDHGILTAMVFLEGEGWGVGFGGYALDAYNGKERRGTVYGCQWIIEVLRVVGVDSWEKVTGQHVRVETEGLGGKARKLGHITKNLWFDPAELAARLRPSTTEPPAPAEEPTK